MLYKQIGARIYHENYKLVANYTSLSLATRNLLADLYTEDSRSTLKVLVYHIRESFPTLLPLDKPSNELASDLNMRRYEL